MRSAAASRRASSCSCLAPTSELPSSSRRWAKIGNISSKPSSERSSGSHARSRRCSASMKPSHQSMAMTWPSFASQNRGSKIGGVLVRPVAISLWRPMMRSTISRRHAKLRGPECPRQPLRDRDRHGRADHAGQEAIEIRELHGVLGRLLRAQVCVEGGEVCHRRPAGSTGC